MCSLHLVHALELVFAEGAGGVTDPRAALDPLLAQHGIHPEDGWG